MLACIVYVCDSSKVTMGSKGTILTHGSEKQLIKAPPSFIIIFASSASIPCLVDTFWNCTVCTGMLKLAMNNCVPNNHKINSLATGLIA